MNLTVGIGIPIPILNEEILTYTAIKDEEIRTQVVDFSHSFPNLKGESLAEVNYKQLKSGTIAVNGKEVRTGGFSSYAKAKEIAKTLKNWIEKGKFLLTEAVAPLPSADSKVGFKLLIESPIQRSRRK